MSIIHRRTPILSVFLSAPQGANDYVVTGVELRETSMRQRLTPQTRDKRLASVLRPDFVAFLREQLLRLNAKTMVLADAETEFSNHAIRLAKVQIMSTLRDQNERHIVIRFLDVSGDVQALLGRATNTTEAETNSIAMSALEDVVGRTYDAACVYEQVAEFAEVPPPFSGRTRGILSKRQELLFRLDLLQRAVAAKDRQRPDADLDPTLLATG